MQTISGLALAIISTFQYVVALTQAANRSHEHRTRLNGKQVISITPSHTVSISDGEESIAPSSPTMDTDAHEDILGPSLKLVDSLLQAESRLPTSAIMFLLRLANKIGQPWLERYVKTD
jgi:hypothetical protein